MNEPQSPTLHGWGGPQAYGGGYPGLGDPFAGPPGLFNAPMVQPAVNAAPKPGLLSNLGDVKQLVDRMGGIDGILSTVGKVQKFMAMMQQMAPLLRLFMGKVGGAQAAAAALSGGRTGRPRRRAPGNGRGRNAGRKRRPKSRRPG